MSILLFPGQGSRGVSLDERVLACKPAQNILIQAEAILGYDTTQLTPEQLGDTQYSQVHLFVCSVAMSAAFQVSRLVEFVAGHSLGQYSALVAARGLPFEQALDLVRQRADLMAECARELPGTMIACIGNNVMEIATNIVGQFTNLYVANYNSSQQVVVSGAAADAAEFMRVAKENGIRCVKLPVAGAFHSPFMAKANEQMNRILQDVRFADVDIGFISNKTGDIILTGDKLRSEFVDQIVNPVKWTVIAHRIQSIARPGLTVYEVSYEDVLTNLTRVEVGIDVEPFTLEAAE